MPQSHQQLTDEELIVSITRDGKTELFGLLYERYSDKVFRKCLSFVKDEDQARDMVQEVLLKVFAQLPKFKGNSRFSTWLYAITYNYCVEHYRKRMRYMTVDLDEGPDLPEPNEQEEQELLNTRKAYLEQALEKMPEEDRSLLIHKYKKDQSIKDLMQDLDITESAVKMRLSRARQRVRRLIEEAERKELNYR
ncbi:MAG: sigma-70 family RNA polymerase sigma factor [Bacteroidota bacterium]